MERGRFTDAEREQVRANMQARLVAEENARLTREQARQEAEAQEAAERQARRAQKAENGGKSAGRPFGGKSDRGPGRHKRH